MPEPITPADGDLYTFDAGVERGVWRAPAGTLTDVSFGTPGATVKLTSSAGVATTALRSDAQLALDVSIAPTWSGQHTFTLSPVLSALTASRVMVTDGSKKPASSVVTQTAFETAFGNQTANTVWAGPTSGGAAAPAFRALVAADLPGSFSGFANPTATIGLTATNGSATTAMRSDAAPALNQAIAPTWTSPHAFRRDGIGTTTTDAVVLENTTAAAAGAQQFSPRLRLAGRGWKTASGGASQAVEWAAQVVPVQGSANPTSALEFISAVNGAAFANVLTLFSSGALGLGSITDPGAAGVLNVSTGFRIGNAAASGNVLRGDGTNFVSSQLATTDLSGAAALTRVDDTNVTLTLGGTPGTSLLRAVSLTLGWTGTLAAARLNANVVQAVTNDTNVTGSISSQNLTLGWTGQLAVARGGTGAATLASNGVLYGNGNGAVQALVVNASATNKFLRQVSSGAPSWEQVGVSDLAGLGTGVATFLATPSSANLAAAITDETGSGALVFATSPTLVTPTLGVATATSINKVAITAPATSATLTIADGKTATHSATTTFAGVDGKTLTVNNTLTLTGTDTKVLTLTGSLTVAADTTISGGGTLALGGFTFTIPATGTAVITTRTLTAGNGLTGGGDLSADRTFTLGTPSTLTVATTNSVSGTTHTHAVTSSSNPGAAASLLATDASGFLTLVRLTATDYVFVNASTANVYLKDTSTGFQSASTTVITLQASNALRSTSFTSGLVGWGINAAGDAEFANVTVRGAIRSSVLLYNAVLATNGSQITTKAAAKLRADVVVPSSPTYGTTTVTIDVVDQDGLSHAASQLFVVNDVLQLKDGLTGVTWFKVTAVSDQTTFWRYTVSIQAGTNNVTYRAGLGVLDYGQSGAGFIVQTADQTNSPYLQMATHAATFSSADASGTLSVTPQLRLGNLNGSYGYGANIYGFGTGQYGAASKTWVTVDQTNGFRIGNNTTVLGQWDTSGNVAMGQVATDSGNAFWNNSNKRLEFRGGSSGTTISSYIDTSGTFVMSAAEVSGSLNVTGNVSAAAGGVVMNSAGLTITGDSGGTLTRHVRFTDGSGGGLVDIGGLYSAGGGSGRISVLPSDAGRDHQLILSAASLANKFAEVQLSVSSVTYGGTTASLYSHANGTFFSTANIGINVGAAGTSGYNLYVNGTTGFAGNVTMTSGNFGTDGYVSALAGFRNGTMTAGRVLRSDGTNFISAQLAAADIVSGAALTKTDDTNVTLTLGGSHASALLAAASLTLGWTGQLSAARGGTGANLSATGGASQVLMQTSTGAAITVAQLAASNLSNGVTGTGSVVLSAAPTFTGDVTFDTNTLFVDASNDRVGIGTTSPVVSFHVLKNQNGVTALRVSNSNSGNTAYCSFQMVGDGAGFSGSFFQNSSGNVSYGGANSFNVVQQGNAALTLATTDTVRVTISGGGNVRFHAYGAGTLTTDASGNITASSDETLKDIKGEFTVGLSALRKVTPVNFEWKREVALRAWAREVPPEDEHPSVRRQRQRLLRLAPERFVYHGFTAQNIAAAIPGAVGENEDGTLTFQERALSAVLVNSVKELDSEVEELRARVADLERQLLTRSGRNQ